VTEIEALYQTESMR